ncbi:MAG TPA: hypothetical protein VJJ02_00985 [Candidatus Paceibacterota bacterium]
MTNPGEQAPGQKDDIESVTKKLQTGEYALGEVHALKPFVEHTPEQFPTPEELRSVFEQLLGGKEYEVLVSREDHFLIETTEDGKRVEYDYAKAKYDYKKDELWNEARVSASIHKICYDGDMPISGECVANYLDGRWKFPA